jgi:hypothetical protein
MQSHADTQECLSARFPRTISIVNNYMVAVIDLQLGISLIAFADPSA